jgi:hypothetical protein
MRYKLPKNNRNCFKKTKSAKELAISEHGMAKLKKRVLARLAA